MESQEAETISNLSNLNLNPDVEQQLTKIEQINQQFAQNERLFAQVKWETTDNVKFEILQNEQRLLRTRRWKLWQELSQMISNDGVIQITIADIIDQLKRTDVSPNNHNLTQGWNDVMTYAEETRKNWIYLLYQNYNSEYNAWAQLDEIEQRRLLIVGIINYRGDIRNLIAPSKYTPELLTEIERWKYIPPRYLDQWNQFEVNFRQQILNNNQNLIAWYMRLSAMDQKKYSKLFHGGLRWNLIPNQLKNLVMLPHREKLMTLARLAQEDKLDPAVWSQIYRSANMMLNPPAICQSCFFRFTNLDDFERMYEEEIRREEYLRSIDKRMFTYAFQGLKQRYVTKLPTDKVQDSNLLFSMEEIVESITKRIKKKFPELTPEQIEEKIAGLTPEQIKAETAISADEHRDTAIAYAEAKPWLRAAVRYGIKRSCCLNSLMTGYSVLPSTSNLDNDRILLIKGQTNNAQMLPRLDEQELFRRQQLFMRKSGKLKTDIIAPFNRGYITTEPPQNPEIMSNQFMIQPGIRRPPESEMYTLVPRAKLNVEKQEVDNTTYPIATRRTYNDQINLHSHSESSLALTRAIVQIQLNGQNINTPETFYYDAPKNVQIKRDEAQTLSYANNGNEFFRAPHIKRYVEQQIAQHTQNPNQWQLTQENIYRLSRPLKNEFRRNRYPVTSEEQITLNFIPIS